uniref:Sin3a_C domain-containing protein n=1 Tax=Rodentolepis nana TaxID=102285 RepID=A0A0R3TSE7_RODNA
LKNCPHTVVPIVIQRMNQKEAEWSESLRKFQQHWGEQDSKNYLRSLDHQGNHFRNRDNHLLRPKAAICAIENIARGERAACTDLIGGDNVAAMLEKGLSMGSAPLKPVSPSTLGAVLNYVVEGNGENGSMHMTLEYPPPETCASLLQDVASLIIHHLKRQNTSKEDKRSMKYFMRTVLQDLFMQERFPMSDDEAEEDEDGHGGYLEEDASRREVVQAGGEEIDNKDGSVTASISRRVRECPNQMESMEVDVSPAASEKGESRAQSRKHSRRKIVKGMTSQYKPSQGGPDDQQTPSGSQEECYCFIMGNNHLYSFLRMHHLLFTRLFLLRTRAEVMQKEYREENRSNEQVSNILSLRKKDDKEPGEYYALALNLVKEVLDGCEDAHTYEDRLRDMFGIYAYPWFTMDRIVMTLVKQLQAITLGDEVSCRLTEEFKNYFKPSGSRSRNDSERIMEGVSEARFIPMSNDICGPVRTRYMRIRNEVKFQYSAFRLCVQQALSSNDEAEDDSNGEGNNFQGSLRSLPSADSIPNCYTFVMVRQASKLLIRLNDPNYMLNALNRSLSQDVEPFDYEERKPSCSSSVLPLSPRTRVKAANAFKRAIEEETGEIHSWYDYLARYLLIPGCWTAGPVSANLVAEVKPVFLYRNVRKYVKRLTNQAVARRMSEAIATIDPQPEEILLRSAEAGEGSSEQEDLEKDICVVMRRVLRNNLTRSEIFRDCYSSDCMQSSSKSLRSAGSTPKANTCKISWSVGSYGIFIRSKKNRPIVSPDRMPKAAERFRAYQAKWLEENGNPDQIEAIMALFKHHSGCYDGEEIQKSPALVADQSDELKPEVVVDQVFETNQTTIEPSIPEDPQIPTTSTTAVEVEKETPSTTTKEPKVEQMEVSSATE